MNVRDIMSAKVVSISTDDTLQTVSEIMELGSVRHLPVVRRGELVGVVSQRDLLRASLSSIMGIPPDDQSFFLAGVSIAEVMSSPAVSIGIDASVEAAAGLMAERKIGCLTVLDGEKFSGLVTETDVLRCFAESLGAGDG